MPAIKGRCQPAYNVICRLGGVNQTAKILKINPSTVSRWMTTRMMGGSGGGVPQKHWYAILKHCKRYSINMDLHDLSGLKRE